MVDLNPHAYARMSSVSEDTGYCNAKLLLTRFEGILGRKGRNRVQMHAQLESLTKQTLWSEKVIKTFVISVIGMACV